MNYLISLLLFFLPSPSYEVSVSEFAEFVDATGYVTTAEQLGWSFVAVNYAQHQVIQGANWRCPDGENTPPDSHPVTQVSWYDAQAYAEWAGGKLFGVQEWAETADWSKPGNIFPNNAGIPVAVEQAGSMLGNVWEWTSEGAVIGGSFLCAPNTCAGYERNNAIHWPGKDTGNNNIGFRITVP